MTSTPHQEGSASPLRSGCPPGPNLRLSLGSIALSRGFCQSRSDEFPRAVSDPHSPHRQAASRLWRPLAPLLLALFITACATKKESAPPTPAPSDQLTASFVDEPATGPKTNPLAALAHSLSNLFPKKSPAPPAASPVQWAGEIRMVNVAENFVLVESNSASSTAPGEKYLAIRDSRETGVLRMTSMRNPPFLIADIVSGNPSPGDKIHLSQPIAPPPPPPAPAPPAAEAPSKPAPPHLGARLQSWLREILPTRRPKP